MMKYIVVKNEKDIRKALCVIKNKKYTDYEIGIRFEVQGKATLVFSTINRYGERIVHDPNTRRIVCNIVVHRVYPDYTKVRSGDPIHHYDIVGPAEFVGNHGVITNIENSSPNAIYYSLNDELEVIYDNIFDKTKDTTFYRKWEKTHDTETGFANIPKNKRYKIKSKSIK